MGVTADDELPLGGSWRTQGAESCLNAKYLGNYDSVKYGNITERNWCPTDIAASPPYEEDCYCSLDSRVRMEGWRQWPLSEEKNMSTEKTKEPT